MKIHIAKTQYYHLQIDKEKNRIYFTILARWNGIEDFKKFFDEWKKGVDLLELNFTIHSDLRLMPKLSYEVENLFGEIQIFLVENGLLGLGEIPADNDISNLQVHRLSEKNKMPTNKFKTSKEVEKYLDELICTQVSKKS
ncbi:hypothetical protein Fleli_3825 [Bernardetia litoralis DSM 6794]|uniref:Uncharacterized protein n=1 Tax=Bernardetia litoralis (strain ATCC 23117 / DSM 6794 / NBRC 15988 / NCIMB 1366 / Fx l1 / Sio-4) TaxID=880071 RepID=I4AQ96_BERLS|nr:hypothetical protein [Bernardetia litoralis]AFM06131.1 hypothetical protein Fleli_3825 [Bernardetia litoralis DSM 6794]